MKRYFHRTLRHQNVNRIKTLSQSVVTKLKQHAGLSLYPSLDVCPFAGLAGTEVSNEFL